MHDKHLIVHLLQIPFYKYLPAAHFEHSFNFDSKHSKQLFSVKQHYPELNKIV
jgi:hypothetical protein